LRNNRYIFNGEGPHTFVRTTKEFEVSIAEEIGGGCDHWGGTSNSSRRCLMPVLAGKPGRMHWTSSYSSRLLNGTFADHPRFSREEE
jgi:hypothetical protein